MEIIKIAGQEQKSRMKNDILNIDFLNQVIICVAKKGYGKSTILLNIILRLIDPNTEICIFSMSAQMDKTYEAFFKKYKYDHVKYETSLLGKKQRGVEQDNLAEVFAKGQYIKGKEKQLQYEKIKQKLLDSKNGGDSLMDKVMTLNMKKQMQLQMIKQLKEYEKEMKDRKYDQPYSVIIIDDLMQKEYGLVTQVIRFCRHYQCLLIISQHSFKNFSSLNRQLANTFFLGGDMNEKYIKQICEEILDGKEEENEFKDNYRKATDQKYNFLQFTPYDKLKYSKNFKQVIER